MISNIGLHILSIMKSDDAAHCLKECKINVGGLIENTRHMVVRNVIIKDCIPGSIKTC